jgi:5-formyltetrahydrofolate cyclo-ligase
MNTAQSKRALRRRMVETLRSLDPSRLAEQNASLAAMFPTLCGLAEARTVLLYMTAFPEEIDTRPMIHLVLDQGQRLVLPRVDRREHRLRLFEVRDLARDLSPGTLAIPEPREDCPLLEPSQVDWALIPGLIFDTRGYRVGRGAGHYDRLLPELRPEVLRWALIHDEQWVEEVPIEPHDVPLDGVASASKTLRWVRD